MTAYPIPPEALKESVAIIGRTGSGKTFAAKGAVELLLREGARVCIIDPTSVWWGLRSSADGKRAGLPVVVFGGDHGDVATNEHSGQPLATLIASQNLPAIIDVAEFTMGGRVRFMTAFLENLYRLNKTPLTLVIDEADLFAPQRAMPDQTVMLSRMEQIVRRGRVRGFRPWLITQRPAELHKSVLSQANTLVAMQLTAPQDRDAVGAWIEGQADRVKGKEILADLARLKKGEGWVWSPTHDVLARVRFPAITTYDSGRSPEEGETAGPTKLAEVDLSAIGESLRVAEAEIADNDPKLLRARIRELEVAKGAWSREEIDAAYKRGREDGARVATDYCAERFEQIAVAARAHAFDVRHIAGMKSATVDASKVSDDDIRTLLANAGRVVAMKPAERETKRPIPATNGAKDATLPKGERAVLIACAQHPNGCTREQLSVLTGYKRSSRDAYVQRLRERAYVETSGEAIVATANGIEALGSDYEPLPTGDALLQHWIGRLPMGEAAILDLVVSKYPKAAERDWLSEKSGYQRSSRDAYIQRLRSRKLVIPVGRGEVKASADLFE